MSPNRSGNTYGRTGRRVRLWLRPETWRLVDEAAEELYWDNRAPTMIERIVEDWAKYSRHFPPAAPATSSIGPVEPVSTEKG